VTDETKDPELLRLIREAEKRAGRIEDLDWEKLMFEPQRNFIMDPGRLKVACCSRRAGKSHSVALALLKAGFQHPGSFPVYINMNRASAKVIIWPALREINERLNLGLKFNQATSDVTLPNGSTIKVYGAGSRREMDKMRGGKPPLACLDEAQNMGSDMEYLITEILLPATADYKASILVTGTPNASCSGPFYNITHGEGMGDRDAELGWSVHHWTMGDNPYILEVEEEYDLAKRAKGWTDLSPGFRREYRGEWVRDTMGLCFELPNSMIVDEFPVRDTEDWRYILGVDLGTVDPCAFTILAYSRALATTYVLMSYKDSFTTLSSGTEIERLMDLYKFDNIVVDSGGQGAAFINQWKESNPMVPARPVKKGYDSVDMGIGIVNSDSRAGKLKIVKSSCRQLIDEMQILIWDDRKSITGKRMVKKGDNYPDHCADSLRYAYQKVRTHDTRGFGYNDMLEPGSREWVARKASRERANVMSESTGKPKPYWQKLVTQTPPKL
jgi:hypothetical protein